MAVVGFECVVVLVEFRVCSSFFEAAGYMGTSDRSTKNLFRLGYLIETHTSMLEYWAIIISWVLCPRPRSGSLLQISCLRHFSKHPPDHVRLRLNFTRGCHRASELCPITPKLQFSCQHKQSTTDQQPSALQPLLPAHRPDQPNMSVARTFASLARRAPLRPSVFQARTFATVAPRCMSRP